MRSWWAIGLAACALGGCGGGGSDDTTSPSVPASIQLTSPAFPANGRLPVRFTCAGKGVSPPLTWSAPPAATRSLALVLDDPDAAGGAYTHWVVVVTPGTGALPQGGAKRSLRARNSSGRASYAPPCPPPGDRAHHYVFTLYALNQAANFTSHSSADTARQAIASVAIAKGVLIAHFARAGVK